MGVVGADRAVVKVSGVRTKEVDFKGCLDRKVESESFFWLLVSSILCDEIERSGLLGGEGASLLVLVVDTTLFDDPS